MNRFFVASLVGLLGVCGMGQAQRGGKSGGCQSGMMGGGMMGGGMMGGGMMGGGMMGGGMMGSAMKSGGMMGGGMMGGGMMGGSNFLQPTMNMRTPMTGGGGGSQSMMNPLMGGTGKSQTMLTGRGVSTNQMSPLTGGGSLSNPCQKNSLTNGGNFGQSSTNLANSISATGKYAQSQLISQANANLTAVMQHCAAARASFVNNNPFQPRQSQSYSNPSTGKNSGMTYTSYNQNGYGSGTSGTTCGCKHSGSSTYSGSGGNYATSSYNVPASTTAAWSSLISNSRKNQTGFGIGTGTSLNYVTMQPGLTGAGSSFGNSTMGNGLTLLNGMMQPSSMGFNQPFSGNGGYGMIAMTGSNNLQSLQQNPMISNQILQAIFNQGVLNGMQINQGQTVPDWSSLTANQRHSCILQAMGTYAMQPTFSQQTAMSQVMIASNTGGPVDMDMTLQNPIASGDSASLSFDLGSLNLAMPAW